jgi:hypothetical protein
MITSYVSFQIIPPLALILQMLKIASQLNRSVYSAVMHRILRLPCKEFFCGVGSEPPPKMFIYRWYKVFNEAVKEKAAEKTDK